MAPKRVRVGLVRRDEGEWRDLTIADYTWRLESQVCRSSRIIGCGQITVAEVDRYSESKVREGRLSPRSINMGLTLLGQILDVADERDLIDRNPLRVNPKRRRMRAAPPTRTWLDRAEQIAALLDAAGELDRESRAAYQASGGLRCSGRSRSLAFGSTNSARCSGATSISRPDGSG